MPESPSSSRVKRLGINALSSVATRCLSATVLVWVNQHLLRRIAPEEYSLFPLVMSLMVLCDLFLPIFVGGISRHLVEAHHRDDPSAVPRIVSSMLVVLFPVALVLALAGALAAWHLDSLVEIAPEHLGQARWMLLLMVFTVCVTTATTPIAQGLYVVERFVTENAVALGIEVLRIVLLLTLLFALGTRVLWLVVASTLASLVGQAVHLLLTRRALPGARFDSRLVSWATIKSVLSFGAWTSVNGLGQLLSSTAPILLLNRFARPIDVAMFHVGRLPDIQLRGLLQAVEGPAQPALVGLYAREGRSAVNQLYYRGGRYYLWLALLPVAPLLVFAQTLYRLYAGDEYARAGSVMIALLASYPLLFASGMFYRVAHAIGRMGAFQAYFLIVQLTAVVAMVYAVAIRREGALGAALALGLTHGLLHLFLIWPLGLRLVKGNWGDFLRETLARGLAPFAAALGVSFAVALVSHVDSWWALGAAAACAGLVYLGVLVAFCMDQLDRDLLGRALGKVRSWASSPTRDEHG